MFPQQWKHILVVVVLGGDGLVSIRVFGDGEEKGSGSKDEDAEPG